MTHLPNRHDIQPIHIKCRAELQAVRQPDRHNGHQRECLSAPDRSGSPLRLMWCPVVGKGARHVLPASTYV